MVSTQTISTYLYLMYFYTCPSSQATTFEVADQHEYDYVDETQLQERDNEGYTPQGDYLELTATPRESTESHYMEQTARHVDSDHVDNNA